MTQQSPFNEFTAKKSQQLFEVSQRAKKTAETVPPLGHERVTVKTLRERWPHMGSAARGKFLQDRITEGDDTGGRAVMELLMPEGNSDG